MCVGVDECEGMSRGGLPMWPSKREALECAYVCLACACACAWAGIETSTWTVHVCLCVYTRVPNQLPRGGEEPAREGFGAQGDRVAVVVLRVEFVWAWA